MSNTIKSQSLTSTDINILVPEVGPPLTAATDTLVTIYTDGACQPNPGPGGWACVMRKGTLYRELSGPETSTTNNRMELMAAIKGLESLTVPSVVSIFTDSMYLKDGITKWLPGWEARGWSRPRGGKPVLNADLWQRLKTATQGHRIEWQWVKGHSGDVSNERADRLATQAALSVALLNPTSG